MNGNGNGTGTTIAPELWLPEDPTLEGAVLASMLLDPPQIDVVTPMVDVTMFHRPRHRFVYEALCALHARQEVIDLITLHAELSAQRQLEEVGWIAYLIELADCVATAVHAERYAGMLRRLAIQRRAILAAGQVQAEATESTPAAIEEVLEAAQTRFEALRADQPSDLIRPVSEGLHEAVEQIERASTTAAAGPGLRTGFRDLDLKTGGFQAGDLIVLAGRPSMGKTALALDIARSVAECGGGVGLFSLEMSHAAILHRLLAATGLLDLHQLRTGRLDGTAWARLSVILPRIQGWPILVDETAGITIETLRVRAMQMAQRQPCHLLIVDYLQLMQGPPGLDSREQVIASVSRGLKMLAKELNLPVLALSQLNRGVEHRAENRPQLSDLRESGAIEQDADVVLLLYRPAYYRQGDVEERGKTEVIIAKQRNGPVGSLDLVFLDTSATFRDVKWQHGDEHPAQPTGDRDAPF